MLRKIVVSVLLAALATSGARAQTPAMSARDSALHALNRLAYGPRPGEVERVAAMGVMNWIARQLLPEKIDDSVLARREREFEILRLTPDDLGRMFAAARRDRRAQRTEGGRRDMAGGRRDMARGRPDSVGAQHAAPLQRRQPQQQSVRRLAGELQQLAVVRAVTSERQLLEVMADFWTNHFNVFYAKGLARIFTPDYVERTIRPNALGQFDDLLVAVAKSPAMLFYLDNAQSVAPGASPPGRRSRVGAQHAAPLQPNRLPRGLNENYARELLELHTLGVDGGYTQADVVAVARIFTGWSVRRPVEGVGFVFREWAHDRGEKQVLGVGFQGDGMDEGLRLLRLLAGHHATMHNVSRKLCARFVADDPPDGCVDAAAEAWHHSNGDVRQVLRAIFRSPDFWAPQYVRSKVKTPLEFVASAVRAVGGTPDSTPRLAQVVSRLGQPLYLQPVPTGYPETQDDWVNSGALLNRMNVAVALAAGRLPGVTVDLDRVLPLTTPHSPLTDLLNHRVLSGMLTQHTRDVIGRQTADIGDPGRARAFAVGLAIGGPEFQRQ